MINAHLTEWVFLAVVLVSLIMNVWGLIVAIDRRAKRIQSGQNGILREVAFAAVMDEVFLIIVALLLLYVASLMVMSPPPPPALTPRAIWGRIFSTMIGGTLMCKTLFNHYMRLKIVEMDRRHQDRRHDDIPGQENT